MGRGQFTFYASFASALSRIKKKADRADAYDAICNYALYGTEPDMEKLPDSAAIAFDLIRPTLDASRRKAESGKTGGSRKQTGSKPEANRKLEQTGREKEKEKENEKENEIENEDECLISARNAGLAAVIDAYRSRICATPSTSSMDELKGYVERMGPECCQKAIDAAVDAGVRSWAYVRSILQAREAQGVKSLEDWQRADEEHERRKKASQPVKKGQITSGDPAKFKSDLDWMDKFLEETEGNG